MRTILLADMNSFFASVHQAVDTSLRGRPVIIGGDPEKRHGIVLAASYEAKAFGIKTGMAVREARSLCPDGVFLLPGRHLYRNFSDRILSVMNDFTPLVEPFSIDEAFMDITGCRQLPGDPVAAARLLKERIKTEIGVLCSVGIGPNKLLAKMAAEMQKPDGLTVLRAEDVPSRLWPLPVRELFGIGPQYDRHLRYFNIHTIGDLANFPVDVLKKRFGVMGEVMWRSANGVDHDPVDPHSGDDAKSVGHQITLPRDALSRRDIAMVLLELSDLVASRARRGGHMGRTVKLTLRDGSLTSRSHSRTLNTYTDLAEDLYETALQLLDKYWSGYPVRMIGLSLDSLVSNAAPQGDIFGRTEKLRRVAAACDQIRSRYGEKSIKRASTLARKEESD